MKNNNSIEIPKPTTIEVQREKESKQNDSKT